MLVVVDVGAGGCIGFDTVDVRYVPCLDSLQAPNVFTPNFDGINDDFVVDGVCAKSTYSIMIFDRWGVEVFASTHRRQFWDGRTTSGEILPDGTYFYVIKVDGVETKGFVTLLR